MSHYIPARTDVGGQYPARPIPVEWGISSLAGLKVQVFELAFAGAPIGVSAGAAPLPTPWPTSHQFVIASISLLTTVNDASLNQARVNGLANITYAFTNPTTVQGVRLTILSFGT